MNDPKSAADSQHFSQNHLLLFFLLIQNVCSDSWLTHSFTKSQCFSVSHHAHCFLFSAASGDVQTYQIRTAPTSTIAPGVVMASSPALPAQPAEEAARKREVRLMKNRYIRCLYLDCCRSRVTSDYVSRIFALGFFFW